jgi:hypothetical protein
MPLQELQMKTTSTEFLEWLVYLEKDLNAFHREDCYLAQIAAEVRRGNTKTPKRVKDKDFILKFKMKRSPTKENIKKFCEEAKMFWYGLLGIKGK